MFSKAYKRYALLVLTLVYTLNLVDRGLMVLMLQPIKEDLTVSDTQLGFLTGIAFALFYSTLGIPIARRADRDNRAKITAIAIALWGATVMSSVFVTTYLQLVCARIAAAVGEAGCKPPTYSLLGDYFPGADERTRAMAVYWLGGPLSALISFALGGWLGELYGWRMTFFLMGVPGLLIAALVRLTIVEPRSQRAAPRPDLPPIRLVLSTLWRQPSCRHLSVALILLYLMGFGLNPWYAAFMMRSHGMGTAELGAWLGTLVSIGGVTGVLLGGYIGSQWLYGNERGQVRLCSISLIAVVPCLVAFLTLPNKHYALLAMLPFNIVFSCFYAPAFALMQRLVPDSMRATTLAVVLLLANLIGMGIGPQIVGILSDWLAPTLGSDSLRYSMLAVSLAALWAAYHFWQVGRTVGSDLASSARESESGRASELRTRIMRTAHSD
jgi:MFS family permease